MIPVSRISHTCARRTQSRSPKNPEGAHVGIDIDPLETIEELREDNARLTSGNEKLNGFVAVTVAILATFLGIFNVKDDNIVQAMLQEQAHMIDYWNFYQARNIREEIAAGDGRADLRCRAG